MANSFLLRDGTCDVIANTPRFLNFVKPAYPESFGNFLFCFYRCLYDGNDCCLPIESLNKMYCGDDCVCFKDGKTFIFQN